MRLISVATCRRPVSTAGIRKIPQRSAARKWKVEMQFVHAAQIPSKEVSADSADLSPNSLERYLDRDADGNWQGFVLGPETDDIGTAKSRLPCVDIHASQRLGNWWPLGRRSCAFRPERTIQGLAGISGT
jgi:hypothetical protein